MSDKDLRIDYLENLLLRIWNEGENLKDDTAKELSIEVKNKISKGVKELPFN